jgi:hypothetical protein
MPGRGLAVSNGDELVKKVVALAQNLGLDCEEQVHVARRIWGAKRKIDVVLTHPATRKILGVECKYQSKPGTTEEKIPATIQDMNAWPICGLLVFSGKGFTENMKSFLISTGKAVELDELESWLRMFFALSKKQSIA